MRGTLVSDNPMIMEQPSQTGVPGSLTLDLQEVTEESFIEDCID